MYAPGKIGLLVLLLPVLLLAAKPLPQVLILGDSIYQEPSRAIAKQLQDRAEVTWPPMTAGEVRNTTLALANLDSLLGSRKWDLIVFNFGLGDLIYRAPGMKSFRVLPPEAGGVRATSPEQYEANLRELVPRLRQTGAKLVWAHTTPIRSSSTNIFAPGSEVTYNAIAARVMAELQVPIIDMYSFVRNRMDMDQPGSHGVDPFYFDKKPFHAPIVRSILAELNLATPIKGPIRAFIMVGGWGHIGGGTVVDPKSPRPGQKPGTLDDLVLNDKTAADYRHLLAPDGTWATRSDVWVQFDRRGTKSGPLGVGYGGDRVNGIGSELTMGHVLGNHFEEQVYLLKTAVGVVTLESDLRPPGTGKTGSAYDTLVQEIDSSIADLADNFPDYHDDLPCTISGLVLNLGHTDSDPAKVSAYLPALIRDLRTHLGQPDLPVVLVGFGQGGRDNPLLPELAKAEATVAALPEFAGRVTYVETAGLWPPADARESSREATANTWHGNAESFCKIGNAVGEAMVRLCRQ